MTPGLHDLNPAAAKALLEMKFSRRDVKRINELSALAQVGELTEDQAYELDVYLNLGNMLAILHSKARLSLRKRSGPTRRKSA